MLAPGLYVWYNKNIKIGGNTIFNHNLFIAGVWTVSDLFSNDTIIPFSIWRKRGVTELDRILWTGITKVIKNKFALPVTKLVSVTCGIESDFKFISIQKVTQKHIKAILAETKYSQLKDGDEKYKLKAKNLYGPVERIEWYEIFQLLHNAPVDNKVKVLQYKIIMRYVPTNLLLYKIKRLTVRLVPSVC